jgi:hypothetical protein
MKFICITVLLSVALSPTFGQQFSFKELVAMTKSQNAFEQSMAKKANFPKSKWEEEFVQHTEEENSTTVYFGLLKNFVEDSSKVDITRISVLGIIYIENYNLDDETGSTVYQWNQHKIWSVKGTFLPFRDRRNENTLSIKYGVRNEYLKVLDEINLNAKFIKTQESAGFFDDNQLLLMYKYLDIDIEVKSPLFSETGGEIRFIVPLKQH